MEIWDLYDEKGRATGETLVRGEEIPKGRYHLVTHVWYENAKGELLIQRRALRRELMPGAWAATGGSALAGESAEQALMRESEEEMGIRPDAEKSVKILSYLSTDALTDVWLVPYEGEISDLRLQEEEVMDAKWVSLEEFKGYIGKPEAFWQYRYLSMLVRFLDDRARQ